MTEKEYKQGIAKIQNLLKRKKPYTKKEIEDAKKLVKELEQYDLLTIKN